MALTRPQVPDKPPVAAKPRFKPPALPPKPAASLFILSPPSTAKTSSANNNVCKSQKLLPKASDASSCHPEHPVEVKDKSPTLQTAPAKLLKPPPLPSLPPPIQRKGPAHSGSATLPASFRNRHNNRVRLPTSPTINSFTSVAASSSLQRNVSPPLTTAHQPPHHTVLHKHHTFSERHSRSELSHPPVQPIVRDTPQSLQDKCISPTLESQKRNTSHVSPPVPPKPAASQNPAALLCEPSPPEVFPAASSKSSWPSKRVVIPDRRPAGSHKHSVEVAGATDNKSVTGKKAGGPPPIPQNPPRAGTLRKSTSVNTKAAQAAETTPVLEGRSTGDNRRKTVDGDLTHSPRVDNQQSTREKVQKLLQRHQHTLTAASDRSNTPVHAVGTNQKPQPFKTSVTGSPSSVQKTTTPPKPRPRSGCAVQSPLEPEITSNKFTGGNSSRFDQNKAKQTCLTQNTQLSVCVGREHELGYIEVYRGDTDAGNSSHSTGRTLTRGLDTRRQSQNTVEVSVHSGREAREVVSTAFPQCHAEHEASDDFPSLLRDTPEDTCDMLKEIEELLKNKLGNLQFDIEHQDTEATRVCSDNFHRQNSDQSHVTTGVISFVETVSKPSLSSSSSIPPRLAHQSGECTNLRKLQLVGRAHDRSTTNPPSSQNLGQSAGLSSGPDKKIIPAKPKRTFLHRDNNLPDSISAHQHHQEEGRSDSRSDLLEKNQFVDSNPPPLPPRNKPRSLSLREIGQPDSSLPKQDLSADTESCGKIRSQTTRDTDTQPLSQATLQSVQPGTQLICHRRQVFKSRPSRESLPPPPPPGPPRRAATFSPGDSRLSGQRMSGQSDKLQIQEMAASKASPMLKKCYSLSHRHPDADLTDQEASGRIHTDALSPGKDTKRRSKFYTTELEVESSHCTSRLTARASPDGQMQVDKTAKSALFDRVAHSLGLRKSTKNSKITDVSVITSHSRTVSSKLIDDNYVEDKISAKTDADNLPPAFRDDDSASSPSAFINVDPDMRPVQTSLEATDSSSSFSDRPLSETSQRSTSCERFEPQTLEHTSSSGTDTDPEPDMEEIYVQRKAKKVFFIAKEIVSSERTFVDVLRLLNMDFRVHISKSGDRCHHPVVPAETVNKILDFLPQLQNLNEDLLKDLSERVERWDENPRLADIFVKKGPFLKLYTSYIRNFESATAVLEDSCKRNSAFAAAVKEFEMSPRCAKLALKHYMLKPIQRIPQYKLLLQDYLKHVPQDSLEYKDTINALTIVSEVADHANNSMRHEDHLQKLLEVQRSLVGQFEVIQPGRVLIKRGELQKLSRREMQPRMFFLFSDMLLYTTPTSTGYKINNILSLTGMKINSHTLEEYKFEFNIISVQRSFTLCASSFEEKAQWVSAVETAIEENAKKHHTFVAVRQGIEMSLQDKDFILGAKAPVWVHDARVTMCMQCLLEFTLTLRRHHCRSCGRVVCSHCSENKAPLQYLAYEPARVCDSCYEKLKAAISSELERSRSQRHVVSQPETDSPTSLTEGPAAGAPATIVDNGDFSVVKHDSSLSLHGIMDRFQKLRHSNRERRKPNSFIPSVLKEVHGNDECCDMCGYLHTYRSRKWKRLWFVVKGKVLYTYKASQDMAAIESMPLLGYRVTKLHTWFEGHQPDVQFELNHQNNQQLTTQKGGGQLLTHVMSARDKTKQRLIFRTDSAASTEKWLTVLREASLT